MREILFRGKRISDDTWVYGGIIKTFHPNFGGGTTTKDVIDFYTQADNCYAICANNRDIFVWQNSISEFTGLTDKNGKKIFDGDIVYYQCSDVIAEVKIGEYRDTDSHKDAYGCYVEFVEDGQIVQDVMNHMESDETYGCEVIGNIHDNFELFNNSELLEDKP